MRNSFIARFAATLAVISLVLVSASAVYAGGNGWSGWSSWSSDSSYGKSDKSDKSGKSGKGHGGHDEPVNPVVEGNCAIYYAGQHTVVGTVCLTITGDTAFVDYTMIDGWLLSNPHLWIGDTLASAPTNRKGNPIPGQFPFNADVDGVAGYSFEIPVSDLNVNADLLCTEDYAVLVAAHGEVAKDGQHESAWAGETRFTKKGSWATYFGVVPECGDPEEPPVKPVQACTEWAASVEYNDNDLDNVTPELTRVSTTGTDQVGVVATFSVSTSTDRTAPGLLVVASTILPAGVNEQTITFAKLSTVIDGSTVERGDTLESVPPADGEFKTGKVEHQFGSFTLPLATPTPFSINMDIEVCSTLLTDPPTAS